MIPIFEHLLIFSFIFCSFFLFFSGLFCSPVIFEASYLVSAATMLVWELCDIRYGHSRRRHFVAKYSFDMRNLYNIHSLYIDKTYILYMHTFVLWIPLSLYIEVASMFSKMWTVVCGIIRIVFSIFCFFFFLLSSFFPFWFVYIPLFIHSSSHLIYIWIFKTIFPSPSKMRSNGIEYAEYCLRFYTTMW